MSSIMDAIKKSYFLTSPRKKSLYAISTPSRTSTFDFQPSAFSRVTSQSLRGVPFGFDGSLSILHFRPSLRTSE